MYYLRQQTQISGPFTAEQLKSLLHRGRVARSDKISTDKLSWMPISQCAEIIQHPIAAAAPEPAATGPVGDGLEWFYTIGGAEQPAAVTTETLRGMIAAGTVGRDEMLWRDGFDGWQPVGVVAEFADAATGQPPSFVTSSTAGFPSLDLPPVGVPTMPTSGMGGADFQAFISKKVPAGVAALVIGPLGIHKFILGLTTGGVTMLLLCCLLLPIPFLSIVAFVEGLLYLTKSDDAFYRDYAVSKKQWF